MFGYIRYFSIISFVIVIIAAIGLGIAFKNIAGDDLKTLVENNNQALVQGFINMVWKPSKAAEMVQAFRKHDIPPENWNRYRVFDKFSRRMFKYFEGIPAVQVNLYTSDYTRILSVNQAEILDSGQDSRLLSIGGDSNYDSKEELLKKVMAGTITSRIIPDSTFKSSNGELRQGTLVHTLIPVLSDTYVPLVNDPKYAKENNVQGIVEIYFDITQQWDQLYFFQLIGTGGVSVLFILLLAALTIVASKAEYIIARQHETNLELAAQAASAEAENRDKSQFLANISHELRTPLNAIIGFSEIIKTELMGEVENQKYHDYIRDIHSSGVHLLSLINDILDYSKAEAGKLELNLAEVDVTKVVKNSMRLISPRAESAQVTLSSEIPDTHFVRVTDQKKLKQIMLNLLSNAVKFTPANGEVRVTMWHNVVDDSISIEVKDSGIGIAPKDISKAMSPFGQVDSALSRRYEGTGLGLPLTKKFVEIMGGTFTIQSELNVGTTITFTLPKEPPDTLTQGEADDESGTAQQQAHEQTQDYAQAHGHDQQVPPPEAAGDDARGGHESNTPSPEPPEVADSAVVADVGSDVSSDVDDSVDAGVGAGVDNEEGAVNITATANVTGNDDEQENHPHSRHHPPAQEA